MATKLLANADRGLDRALRFRDFFDFVMAALEWPKQASTAMAKAVAAYGDSAGSALEKVADLLRANKELRVEAYERLAMSSEARAAIDQVLSKAGGGFVHKALGC